MHICILYKLLEMVINKTIFNFFRYNYDQLLKHPFYLNHFEKEVDVSTFVSEMLDLPDNP